MAGERSTKSGRFRLTTWQAIFCIYLCLLVAGGGLAIVLFVPADAWQGFFGGSGAGADAGRRGASALANLLLALGPTGTGGALLLLGAAGILASILCGPDRETARRDLADLASMDGAERIVWALAGHVVVLVAALAALGPLRSEISPAMVAAETRNLNRGNAWMAASRGGGGAFEFVPSASRVPARPERARPGAAGEAAAAAATGQDRPAAPEGFEPDPEEGGPAPAPYVPPAPPLTPGVQQTVYIPADAVEKYRHYDELVELLNTAESYDEDYNGLPAVRLGHIPEGHPVLVNLGLQPGDIVISVNGRPAGPRANARQLFEELKDQRDFLVEIDRGGVRYTVPYQIR